MENFKEIVEKCLAGKLQGTFIIQDDKNWHSSYLQRHTISGNEIPGQYVLGPGIIYNDRGQCTSNEKVKIVDFIPDTMKNFKEIAEKCLAGELSGTFVTAFDNNWHSSYLQRYAILGHEMPEQYVLGPGVIYNKLGQCESRKEVRIIDFIPDNMQKKIEIDIPEGKVPVMEQTEKGVVITWKEKELTYDGIINEIAGGPKHIIGFSYNVINDTTSSTPFYRKVDVLRKLINIRNYFGKPDKKNSDSGWVICINGTAYRAIVKQNSHVPVFAEKEHAEQAIKMLGDELKYLFEPW